MIAFCRRLLSLLPVLMLTGLMAACTAEGQKNNVAKLRVFNAVYDSGSLKINASENGDIVTQLTPSSLAPYVEVKSGSQTLKVTTAAGTQILEQSTSIGSDSKQLFIVAGTTGNYVGYVVDDAYTDPADGKFRFRVLHAAAGVAALDAYLIATTDDISQVNPTVSALAYRSTGSYIETTAGTFKLVLTPNGSKEVIYESDPIAFTAKQVVSFLVYPTGSGKLAGVSQLAHTDTGSGSVVPSKISRFKAANAVLGTTMNVLVDGALRLAGIPQPAISSYQSVTAGTRNVRIESTTAPGTALVAGSQVFEPAREYTLLAVGSGTSTSLIALPDNTQTLNTGKVRIRVINAVTGGDPVNLLVNFITSATGVTVNSASKYVELDIGTYNISVGSASTGANLFTLTAQEFTSDNAGKMYAVLLTGTPGNIQAALLSDN